MPEAMTILLFDDSLQVETLGDACLISILSTISSMLHLLLDMIPKKIDLCQRKIYHCINRRRRTIQSLYREYGSRFSRAYQMDYEAFMKLHELLKGGIREYISSNNSQIHDTTRHDLPSFHVHNGEIRSEIRLAPALRYFTGGLYLDITISHGISKTDVYCSVWAIVHATNQCLYLQFRFPATAVECQEIAVDFMFRSKAGFDNCVGCIDGMLVLIEKPFPNECEKVGVDSGKFYCGQKAKFRLNLQGVCDAHRRFTYISVQHPASASASDYLSFVTSSLYQQLTEGSGLPNG